MTDKPKDTDGGGGKTWKGQKFVPTRSVESVQSAAEAQRSYDKPGAVDLVVYFASKGVRNPVMQAAMRAYTTIQRATVEDWDRIFETF